MDLEMTPAWAAWIDDLAKRGGPVARDQDLPVAAMLACGSVESAWGTSSIYKATNNPFNLQKWPRTLFPHTHKTHWNETVVETGPPKKVLKAPFNCATDPADAVLQWCEWIVHYGRADGPGALEPPGAPPRDNPAAIRRKEQLLAYRHNSLDFAYHLPLVGFGETQTPELRIKSGKAYRARLFDFGLTRYD